MGGKSHDNGLENSGKEKLLLKSAIKTAKYMYDDVSSTIAVQAVLAMAPTLRCYYAHSQLCWSLMGGAIKGNESHSTFLYCFLGSRAYNGTHV